MKLWNRVLEAGKPHDLEVIGPCHIRRIEGGILAFGADMWYENNPFEVGYHYTWMVDLEQEADFMGKEALKKIKAEGVKQKLVGVDIEGEPLGTYIDNEMIDFFPASAGGSVVGRVTSACHSPRMEKNIGLAMLPIEHAELGTTLEVETLKGKVGATVVQTPHWDPDEGDPQGLALDPGGEVPEHPGSLADVVLGSGTRVEDHESTPRGRPEYRPEVGVMRICCSRPVALSIAETETMPLASTSNETSICGTPRGAGGIPTNSNLPRLRLPLEISRSPCRI